MKLNIGLLIESIAEYKKTTLIPNQELDVGDLDIFIDIPGNKKTKINYVIKKDNLKGIKLITKSGRQIKCANMHVLRTNGIDVFAQNLRIGEEIDTVTGADEIVSIETIDDSVFYDIGIDYPHVYYDSEGILHHNTLITAILCDKVAPYGRTVTIVPNKDLVTQTERDFKLLGLDVGVYFGDRKEPGRTHTICTWQSIEALDRKSKNYDAELDVSIFTDGVVGLIVDEAHGTKASVLQKHLTSTFRNVPIRWGMTGTIPLEELEVKALVLAIGPIIHSVTAKELQDKGVLSNLHITVAQIKDYHTHFDSYQSELKYLVTDEKRLRFLADYIRPQLSLGNSLILVDRIQTGDLLMEMLDDAVFISGKVKSKDRKEEYDSFGDIDNKPIIATYGVAAVGIDIPRIFNLFMIEPGKSYIRVIQSIGRGIRKAKDKDFVNVYDITSTAKYSKRHLTERKKFYKRAQYPFKIIKVDR